MLSVTRQICNYESVPLREKKVKLGIKSKFSKSKDKKTVYQYQVFGQTT